MGFVPKIIRKTPHDLRREQVKDLRIKFLSFLIFFIFFIFEKVV